MARIAIIALGALIVLASSPARAQDATPDDLRARIDALEKESKERNEALSREIEALKVKLAEQEKAREAERTAAEARSGKASDTALFENDAGARQVNEEADPLERIPRIGEDLKGNVYSSENFRIRLGGSLRMHGQWNSTPIGEGVSRALLPDPTIPDGGDAVDRESFRAFASRSRLNLAVQGPDTLGGQTLGFFEMDFAQNFAGGEAGAIAASPRLRHAYMRWTFKDSFVPQDEVVFTMGQTGSSADLTPDTIDVNTMLGGLGAAHRRNPRVEVVHLVPLSEDWRIGYGGGVERPFFGDDFIASDLGPGDLSGYPAFSAGLGVRTRKRFGGEGGFGINSFRLVGRATYGEFVERFEAGTLNPDLGLQENFREREFQNIAAHGGLVLEGIGFNPDGRALTFNFTGGGLFTQGDALHMDAGFDRRTVLTSSGHLEEAQSTGGFIASSFYILDDLSIRWAGGGQFAIDADLPTITGSFDQGFVRRKNYQSEFSIWWTPGPFSFGFGWNHTRTYYRRIDPETLDRDDLANDNDKIEFISWFSF